MLVFAFVFLFCFFLPTMCFFLLFCFCIAYVFVFGYVFVFCYELLFFVCVCMFSPGRAEEGERLCASDQKRAGFSFYL